jgi:Rad3-related DNA helicase
MVPLVLAGQSVKAAARQVENLVTGSRSNNKADRLRHLFGQWRDAVIADYHEREALAGCLGRADQLVRDFDRLDQQIRDFDRLDQQIQDFDRLEQELRALSDTVRRRVDRLGRPDQLFRDFDRLDQQIGEELDALIARVTRRIWLLDQQIREELQALNSATVPVPDP